MKKTILLVGLCFLGTTFAFSQNNPGNAGPKLLNKIKTTCNLTSPQMAKLQPIVGMHVATLQADKQKFSGTELKKAETAENLKFNNQLKSILTADQMKLYAGIQQ